MNYTIDDVNNDLKTISMEDTLFNRMIKVPSFITRYMEQFILNKHGYPIIVGGLSMEIYTHSEYTTQDIDFVTSSSELLRALLLSIGFVEEGHIYFHDEINVAVDIVATALDPMNYDDLVRIELADGRHIYSVSIEAILYDRALS